MTAKVATRQMCPARPIPVHSTTESFTFEVTGASEKLDAFIGLMQPLGLNDVSRTGVVAIARGAGGVLGTD